MAELKMPSINQVNLSGRLVKDPEIRYTIKGTPILYARMANDRHYKKGDTWEKETLFINVLLAGKGSEYAKEKLRKGMAVFVEGRLRSREYESNGNKKTVIEIVARRIQPMEKDVEEISGEEVEE